MNVIYPFSMVDYKKTRTKIKTLTSSVDSVRSFLSNLGIDVTRDNFFKVREERTPSCKINKDGSCHDFGTGDHYIDIVSLLFDGYRAFDSLPETMQWICAELGIRWEDNDE